jgi:hypothetical protein
MGQGVHVMSKPIEERLSALESEVARLKQRMPEPHGESSVPWWEEIRGSFKDDPIYLEAMQLGREWRESQPIPEPVGER